MKYSLLWMHCLTPLHNGSGQGLGTLDRPIIREVTTSHPYVQSSTIKGALKAYVEVFKDGQGKPIDRKQVTDAFGKGESDGNQGRLSFTDAQVLLLPVQSISGTFVWATSLFALSRLRRWLQVKTDTTSSLAKALTSLFAVVPHGNPEVACGGELNGEGAFNDSCIRINGDGPYCIHNLLLTPCTDTAARNAVASVATALAEQLYPNPVDVFWKNLFKPRLLILDHDTFTEVAKHSTQVEANITIAESGVTKDGSLRYTEFLPAETVLVSLYGLEDRPVAGIDHDSVELMLMDTLPDNAEVHLQFGGDESKGKGIARILRNAL